MIIYFNLFIVTLQILSAYSVSIRNRQFRDELVPYLNSRLENYKRDPNSLRIVSDDPFIIQLQVPENWDKKDVAATGDKEKRGNKKRPPTKRFPKLKSWRRRLRIRRDIHEPSSRISPATTEPKLNQQRKHLKGIRRIHNQTSIYPDIKNSVNRQEIKKILNQVIKEAKTNRSRDFKTGEERRGLERSKFRNEKLVREKENSQKTTLKNLLLMMSTLQNRTSHRNLFPFSDRSPIVKLTHPITTKPDQFKNGYREMKPDRETIENKIKNLRNLLKVNDTISNEDLARVRRKTDSDKLANKIAKMFLTLSAVNGMNERKKSKCKDDEDDEDDLWEQERRINPTKKNYSTNEERYKVKKWIEHMKNKRSGKTCPCMAGPTATGEFYEDTDVFPLEQKLGKDYPITAPDTSSEEESLEVFRNRQRSRKYYSAARQNRNRPRYFKSFDDADNKLNALTKRGRRKFELPMEDLESYRSRAKQILQNAEEILDKLKEEEEKRLTNPNMFLNNLKELTSRIQSDPRSHDNDLIKMLQKSLGISKGENDKNAFIEGMKTYVLDPYEKAKALTDESTRQLTNYLLKNLANVGHSGEETDKSEALKVPEIKPLFQGLAIDNSEPNKNVDLLKDINENIEKYSQMSLPLPEREDLKSSDLENPWQKQMNEMFKMQNEKMKGLSESPNEMSETDAMKHLKALEDVVKDFTTENKRSGQDTTDSNIEEPSGLGERLKFLTDRKQGINPLLTGDKEINNPINTDPTVKDHQNTEQLFGLPENPENGNTMTSNNFQPEIDGKELLGNKENGDDTTVGNVDATSTDFKPSLGGNEGEGVMKTKEFDPDIIKAVSDGGNLMKKGEEIDGKELLGSKEGINRDETTAGNVDATSTDFKPTLWRNENEDVMKSKEMDQDIIKAVNDGGNLMKKGEEIDGKELLGSKERRDDITVGNVDPTSTDMLGGNEEEVMKTKEFDPDIIKAVNDGGNLMKKEGETENEGKVLDDGSILKLDDPKTELEDKENDYGILTSEGMDYQEKKPERDDLREPLISQVEKAGSEPSKEKTIDDSLAEIVEKAQEMGPMNPDENLGNTNNDEINQFPETENENPESLVKSALNDELIQTLEALDQKVEELIKEENSEGEYLPEKISDIKESSGNDDQEGNSDVGAENTMNALSSGERQNLDSTSKENKDIVSTENGKETDFDNLGKKIENSREVSGKSLEEIDSVNNENVGESKDSKEMVSSEKDVETLGKKNENSKEISGKSLEEIDSKRDENVGESKENRETVSSEKDMEILEKQNESSKELSGKSLEEVGSVKSENVRESMENREMLSLENERGIENLGEKNENSKEVSGKSLEEVDLVKKENVGESKEDKEMVSSENEKNLSKKKNFSKESSEKNSEETGLKRDENVGESINNKENVSSENEKGIETLGKENENSKEISGKSLEEVDLVKSENVGESKDSKEMVSSEKGFENLGKKKNENFSTENSGKNSEEIGLKRDENVGESINNKEITSSENEKDVENLGKKHDNSKEISGKSLEEIDIVKSENVGESKDNQETISSENGKETDFETLGEKKENSREVSGKSLEESSLVKSENVGESIENKEAISSENERDNENLGKTNENSKEVSGKSLEEVDLVKTENVGENKDSKETVSSENEKVSSKKKNSSKESSEKNSEEISLKRDENVGESIENKETASSEIEMGIENLGKKNDHSKEISGKSLEEIDIVKSENVGESKENKETVISENEGDFQNLSQKDENSKEISGKSLEEVGKEKNEDVGKTQDLSKETSDTPEKDTLDTGDEKVMLPEPYAKENSNKGNGKENEFMSDKVPSTLDDIFAKILEKEKAMAAKAQNDEEAVGVNDDNENPTNTDTETGKSLLEKMNSNERSDSREKDENVEGILSPLRESSETKDAVENAGMETNSKEGTDVRAENKMDPMEKELDENKDSEITPDLEEKALGEKVSSKAAEMSNEDERTGSVLGDENTNVMNGDSIHATDDNENILEKVQSKEMGSVENDENLADSQNLSLEMQKAVGENISGEKNIGEDDTEVRAENPTDGLTEQDILNKPDDLMSNAFSEENKNLENDEADTVRREEGSIQDGDDMMNKEGIEPKGDILDDMVKEGENVEDSLKYPDAENVNNEELLEKVRSEDEQEKEDNVGEAVETGSEVLNLENAAEELQNGYEEMKSDQSDVQMENDAMAKDSGSSNELNEKAEEELVEVENPSMTEMEDMQSNGDDDGSITRSSNPDEEAKTGNIPDENETLVQMKEQQNVEVPEEKPENVEDSQTNGEDVLMPKYDENKPVGDNADQNDKDDPTAMLVQTADEGMLKENEAGESQEVESVRKESQDLPDDYKLKENEAGVSPEEIEGMKRESQDLPEEYQLKENEAGGSPEEFQNARKESQDLSGEHGENDEIIGNKNESFEELTKPDGEKETKDDTFTRSEQRENNNSNVDESDEDPALTMTDGGEKDDTMRESYTPDELVKSGNQEEKDEVSGERNDESAVKSIRDESTEPREESSEENFSDYPVKSENVLGNNGDEMTLRNEADGMSTEENVSGQNTGDEVPKNQANDYGVLGNNAQKEKNNREEGKEYDENLRLKNIDPNYQPSSEMGRHEHIYEYEENKSGDMYDDFDNLVGSHEDGRYINPTNRRPGENLRGENLLKDADYENFIDDLSELTRKEGKEYADYYQGRGRFPPTPDHLMKSKPGKIKIPQSIGKIMKDLGGSKDDLQNLGPEQIDHLIDKLEEADEHEQKESEEVDCREECACADNIRAISRNRGRYEIMKDVLLWMKDMQLNRVLSD